MKKTLLIVAVVITLLSLFGCKVIIPDEQPQKTIYDNFNDMTKVAYTDYSIAVKRTEEGETLNSSYKISSVNGTSKIEYSYEVLNEIEEVDGEFVVPKEYKSVKKGTITVKDGKIVEHNGEKLNIDFTELDGVGLTFDKSYFVNVIDETNRFSATVTNVKGFFGTNVDCTNMTVEINYTASRFQKILISYEKDGCTTEITYTFTK